MGFNKLPDILRQVQERYPSLSKRMKEAESLTRWEAAVGAIIAKHARAVRVEEGVLWVEVDHPIWRSELHHRKRQILALLNGQPATGAETPPIQDILWLEPRRGPGRGQGSGQGNGSGSGFPAR